MHFDRTRYVKLQQIHRKLKVIINRKVMDGRETFLPNDYSTKKSNFYVTLPTSTKNIMDVSLNKKCISINKWKSS